ncbi:family S53 protease [Mycena rosella]|uniref:Family S53 protease n=1 Tax=Mycena rosella TaxID=1033263 RepID=A0AAD7DE81_MYCRO|nr:family S53 protease [Mycena rosella]
MILHERVARVSPEFFDLGPPEGSTVLNLRINLVSSDLTSLEEILKHISAPSSPTYGRWLSREQVEAYVRPSAATRTLVNAWLAQHDITNAQNISSAGDWISFPITISAANRMLGANFSTYAHKPSGTRYIRTLAYSIPAALRNAHIRLIHPTTSYAYVLLPCPAFDVVTPACLGTLYNMPLTTGTENSDSQLAVTGFNNEFEDLQDLRIFLADTRPDTSSSTGFTVETVDGGRNQQYPAGLEAAVDLQYTVALAGATGVPVNFISVGQNNGDGESGFMDFAHALLAKNAPPQVVTTSYAFNSEGTVPETIARSLCDTYMALAARGVSLCFSAGDGGVAASKSQGNRCNRFLSVFPSCPYITLVGATQGIPEQGAYFSSGGFSEYFPQQDWQSNAVNAYLEQLGPQYENLFNRAGRGYPDVSTQGYKIEIILQGQARLVAGTSCSSPILAAMIARLNDELLKAGKPVLGFLNPWLYANPGAFNDITSGNNPGCGTEGFSAANGWDPVTGLGTPNYPAMRAAAGLN